MRQEHIAGLLMGALTPKQLENVKSVFDFYDVAELHTLLGSAAVGNVPCPLVQYRYADKGRKQWGIISTSGPLEAYVKIIRASTLLIGTERGLELARQHNPTALQWRVPNA
jgi:hypothetical protein